MTAAGKARSAVKSGVKRLLERAGFDIVRSTNNRGGVDDFIPFEPTMRAARAAGLSVGDYIDEVMNGTPGATRSTVDELRTLGVFAAKPETVLEIGPGSGRYLEKTLEECSPDRYEIYETAAPWADYLVDTFGVVAQPVTGFSLDATPDNSVDLVQAHKVFNTLAFLGAARYFFEMARVTRPGGRIVFDVMTETCLDPAAMRTWATKGGAGHDSFPAAVPRRTCVDLFADLGCSLEASFLAPLGVAYTEVLVFRKTA
ncbi:MULTISPECIES: class I SAM-dependent methyltransferase [unclassified Streptomyces]|uniref:class I SAM-dependent methyltransferase n=1 Tax=unclassified Streptomyces TaxID=2593676 RepID=UPI002E81AEF2|nr:class I SAM-dependent methyltransferase [Streptomyces sp. NBC_00589]WTI35039.1 class I SAM-dependent methyltransferase [Streptomyces sp. NBC_00775]WUB31287.1 class I SAM-dependent methyltransferase [Streptomyces sp. NBC_00589]